MYRRLSVRTLNRRSKFNSCLLFFLLSVSCIGLYYKHGEYTFKIGDNLKKYNPVCKIPKLNAINVTYRTIKEPECIIKEDWGYIKNNTWYFIPRMKENLEKFKCDYRTIYRFRDDTKLAVGSWNKLTHGKRILDDVFEVSCKALNREFHNYDNIFIQIVNKLKLTKLNYTLETSRSKHSECKPLNILLISYDSVSRTSWLNRLTKTSKFMLDEMKFTLLEGYNIIGDGTPAALIPIYTGYTEEELPNVLKISPTARYVDEAYPFIWKDLHKSDYMTMHLEDMPSMSAFNYRLKGFSNYTSRHYFKQYHLQMNSNKNQLRIALYNFCNGAKKRHKVMIDLIKDFQQTYNKQVNNLVIMHFVENSHDQEERINWIDKDLYDFLSTGYKDGSFDNTAIFLYSDHGPRFADKRLSNDRYLEERMPFFAIYLPNKYKETNPNKLKYLELNSKVLTSPFDIHATLRDLTCLKPLPVNINKRMRSLSLLKKIPKSRNCEHIGISDHFCTCVQEWTPQLVLNSEMTSAILFAIKSINKIIENSQDLCAILSVKQVLTVEILRKNRNKIYKVQFITSPNNGVYETMLIDTRVDDYEFKSDTFSIRSRNDISRIDAYGEQPKCVSNFESNPEIVLDVRKFCFCKN